MLCLFIIVYSCINVLNINSNIPLITTAHIRFNIVICATITRFSFTLTVILSQVTSSYRDWLRLVKAVFVCAIKVVKAVA